MPSVDETLRHAFDAPDEDWVRRAEPARAAVTARHRRQQLVRRGAAAAALVGVAAAAVVLLGQDPTAPSRSDEPVAPPPTSTTVGVGATSLEGTWTSDLLDATDVRAAAGAAGSPTVAAVMLEQLPGVPFRVVAVVRGATLTTTITSAGVDDEVLDMESLSVTGDRVEVRPFALAARTVHTWRLDGDRLTFSFVSSTEPEADGVPGEAWQRLLYDTATFTR